MRRTCEGIGGMTVDREKKIAEIREALEKATQGPWVYDDIFDDIYADKADVIVCNTVGPENGLLIANAPEWLGFLLDELEQTRKESNMLREELHKFQELAIKAANQHKAERDKLIEGLRWYGDRETYEGDVEWDDAGNIIHAKWAPINIDNGQRARDILREVGVTVK